MEHRERLMQTEMAAPVPTAPIRAQFATYGEYLCAISRDKGDARGCRHCWHLPPDWQGSTMQEPLSRLCCWCGCNEGPRHGPYAPKGW